MRIGIDARFYGPQGKGLGRYTQRLIENLEKIDRSNYYIIFLTKENWEEYRPQNPKFKKVIADYRWYTLAEQIFFPIKILRNGIDLMHFPHFNVPILYPKKFIVTIHDLILTKFPTKRATTLGPLLYKIKYLGYQLTIGLAIRRAKKIITVSECTKKELIKQFKVDPEKISVTYEAADRVETGQLKLPETGLERYGIVKKYLLYVGNAYPHKNLEGLLKVFKKLKENLEFEYQLVLVGKEDYFYNRLKNEARGLGVLNKINGYSPAIFFGFSSQEILADLYRNATLYVFPSFYEGFGLPALEAMSYGLTVAASNSSCLPEILGSAALYFDPRDEDNMGKIILDGLNNEPLRQNLIANGFKQIQKYSWPDCAKKTLEIYLSV
jgi:glycosyltransferase involved in cell wall biosynthesis